jgi:hypothetical protein
VFQNEITDCLNSLKNQSLDFYTTGTIAATDRYSSSFSLYPNIQFVKNDIRVTVQLRDKSGNQLALNLTSDAAASLSTSIKAIPTFGTISNFSYDGYGDFVASLSSDVAGSGQIKAYINNESIATVINRDSDTLPTSIVDNVLTYEFIDKTSYLYRADSDSYKQRFGDADVSEDGT